MKPLPRLIAITPRADVEAVRASTERLLERSEGLPLAVMLRDHTATTEALLACAHLLRPLCRKPNHLLLVNRRVDIALACQADGVHLPTRAISPNEARRLLGPEALIGRSCHTAEESSTSEGADYITLSPFGCTPNKGPALEPSTFEDICRRSPRPVYALGGIDSTQVRPAFHRGAYGVAAIRAFEDEAEISKILATLQGLLDT